MAELRVAAGEWWTMDGDPGSEELVLDWIGPPLVEPAAEGRVVVTGYRRVDGERGPWTMVQILVGAEDQAGDGAEDDEGWPARFGGLRPGPVIVYGQPGSLSGPGP